MDITTKLQVQSLRKTPSGPASATGVSITTFANNALPAYSPLTSSSESTTVPIRPPTTKGKGTLGTFYVGYNAYITQSGIFQTPPIPTGWPWPVTPEYVALDGLGQSKASENETFGSMYEHTGLGNGFAYVMQNGRWKGSVNPNISASEVTGGIFNQANVGYLCLHSSYGSTAEIDGSRHSYLRFFDQNTFERSYCRLDDCSFGSPTINGLKFMAIHGCNVLNNGVYNDMYNFGRLPISTDLHLLLSTASVATASPSLGARWALKLIGDGTSNNVPELVAQSWFDAGQITYNLPYPYGETNHISIIFRVSGWPDAFSEHVTDVGNSPSTGNVLDITKQDVTVFYNP